MPPTNIVTFLSFKNLFPDMARDLKLHDTSAILNNKENINALISTLIEFFDPTSVSKISSFQNAFSQTTSIPELERVGLSELNKYHMADFPPENGILFHRDNLLYLISHIIENDNPEISGKFNEKDFRDDPRHFHQYYGALLLINDLIPVGDKSFHKDYLIRSYPFYYARELCVSITQIRMMRYEYIYEEILKSNATISPEKNYLQEGIKEIERKVGVSLKTYFHEIARLFVWFIALPFGKSKGGYKDIDITCFNPANKESFYIHKEQFKENPDLLSLIDHLSLTTDQFKEKFKQNPLRDSIIEGFYRNFQTFFDYPILNTDDETYCIIDLKFLFEGVGAGLLRHIKSNVENLTDFGFRMHEFKGQYGILLEEYFVKLLKMIFGDSNIKKEEFGPDAILETDDYILLFEFTVEGYKFTTLYNEDIDDFKNAIHKILFNLGGVSETETNKKDKGKFIKLNTYTEQYKNTEEYKNNPKKIIPILVTENFLGDYDLLNQFDNIIVDNIEKYSLENLKIHKPLILKLDDIEWFWKNTDTGNMIDQFIQSIINREKESTYKGEYHFNFLLSFDDLNKFNESNKSNSSFMEFFDFQRFINTYE